MKYLIALALLLTGCSFLGEQLALFEWLSHFRVQAMQLSLLFIAYTLWKRKNRQALLWVLIALIHYYPVLLLYRGTPKPAAQSPYRVLLLRADHLHTLTPAVRQEIEKTDPDLILLLKASLQMESSWASLSATYPHQIHSGSERSGRITLLSRLPVNPTTSLAPDHAPLLDLQADLHTPDGSLTFIGTHPPLDTSSARARGRQHTALSIKTQSARYPVLLLGHLDTTPFSARFHRLLSESGLKDSTVGFGFQPTWKVGHLLKQLPLDHLLHDEKILIHHRGVGADIGSDHRPLIVDFSFAPRR